MFAGGAMFGPEGVNLGRIPRSWVGLQPDNPSDRADGREPLHECHTANAAVWNNAPAAAFPVNVTRSSALESAFGALRL